MENQLLGSILNNIVMEKAVRDKIVIQQKEQREQEALKRARDDDDDEFDDEETRKIINRMRDQAMEKVTEPQKEFKRTIGEYREVPFPNTQIVETEFLDYVTKNKLCVVHFYHKDFERCKIMDKHLKAICMQHPETNFLYLNAEKAPFFVEKLHIRSLPTLCLFVDGKMKDKVVGFEGLSGDDFRTGELLAKLARAGLIHKKEGEGFKLVKGTTRKNSGDSEGDSDLE